MTSCITDTVDTDIAAFVSALTELDDGLAVVVDRPIDASGEYFLDVSRGERMGELSYRPGVGFGIYTSPAVYGQRPDEVFADAVLAARRFVELGPALPHV